MIFKYFIISFLITLFTFIMGITIFRKINFKQYVRKLGPKSHFKKQGTPTMGGVYMIIGITLSFIISLKEVTEINLTQILMLLLPLLSYGLIGFIDDYKKITKKNNDGLSAKLKLIFQILFATLYFCLFLRVSNTKVNIFNLVIDFKWFYGIIILLMFVSTSNAFNISDGMDGLAGGLSLIIFCGLLYISKERYLTVFIMCIIGSITAFLCYNIKPAKVFMGDVGSMAIGVCIANMFIILKCEVLLLIFGFVLIVESLSVIIQVSYFKLTKGKRIFLMSPIHHHFELKGIKESNVVIIFWIVEIIFVIVGIYLHQKGVL